MYLTYEDYEEYGGTIEETTFNVLEFEARSYVDWVTFRRLKNDAYEDLDEAVKRCIFELIGIINSKRELLAPSDGENGKTYQTMENDGVRVSYRVLSASDLFARIGSEVSRLIRFYLNGVKNSAGKLVTYRGLYEDE